MKTAVFAGAYKDTSLISRFIANGEKERKILNALLNVAPDIVKLRKYGGNYDYSNDVVEAVAEVLQTRKETKGLERDENTISMFQGTPEQEFFKKILLSKHLEALKDVIKRMREIAEHEQADGGGFIEPMTRSQVSEAVIKEFSNIDLTPDLDSILARSEANINRDVVDSAMEMNAAQVITQDQPTGQNGNINKSLADEKLAGQQLDEGKRVDVSGDESILK